MLRHVPSDQSEESLRVRDEGCGSWDSGRCRVASVEESAFQADRLADYRREFEQ
jgi:hypothetical protein